MAPLKSNARRLRNNASAATSSTSNLLRAKPPPPPRLKYNKRDRPLPLTAKQFRPDTYDIPADSEDDRDQEAGSNYDSSSAARQLTSLYLDPLSAGASEHAKWKRHQSRKAEASLSRIATCVAHTAPRKAQNRLTPRSGAARSRKRHSSIAAKITKSKQANKTKGSHQSAVSRSRKLSASELTLVTTPPYYTNEDDYENGDTDHLSVQSRGTDSDKSTSSVRMPSHSTLSRISTAVPLTALRKRLKARPAKLKYPRKYAKPKAWDGTTLRVVHRGRDGFENAELVTHKSNRRVKKGTCSRRSLKHESGTLQLRPGPLPEVVFSPGPMELALEHPQLEAADNPTMMHGSDLRSKSELLKRQLNIRAREKMIRSQLSTISAPARPLSESSDSEAHSEHDEDVNIGEDIDIASVDDHRAEWDTDGDYDPSSQTSENQRLEEDLSLADVDARTDVSTHANNDGISIDFRQPCLLGQPRRRILGKQRLVEVNEAIVEAPVPNYSSNIMSNLSPIHSTERRRLSSTRSVLEKRDSIVPNSTANPDSSPENIRKFTSEVPQNRYFTHATDILRTLDQSSRTTIVPRRRSSCFLHADMQILEPGLGPEVPETSQGMLFGDEAEDSERHWW